MRKWENIGNSFLPAAFILVLIILWEAITKLYEVPKYILPAPTAILTSLIENRSLFWEHSLITIYEALVGFVFAIVLGVFLAGLMNKYELIKKLIYPILVVSQTIPTIALAPLFMIWLGFGILPKIVIVVLVCFFPVAVSVIEGLEGVDEDLINLMRIMKASEWHIFTKVQIPATLPSFFAGLKIAATYSIMGAVIAEWIGAKSGLGVYMTRAMSSFQTEALFADILIIVLLSLSLFQVLEVLRKKFVK